MNIFILDECPYKAASQLCDKHVVKMVLETTQILSTVANERGHKSAYKSTHVNHPVVKWVNENIHNWLWLLAHGFGLCAEYTNRYNKIHKCETIITQLGFDTETIWKAAISDTKNYVKHTPFVQCMPDEYKRVNAVEAYRAYYIGDKVNIAKWAYTEKPEWFT